MSGPAEISICTHQDYNQILDELHEFWGARDTRHLHHPFLIHEFGNSAFVIRNGGEVVAYCLAFSRRASRLDMCMRSPSACPPAGDASRRSFSATSLSLRGGMAASTSRRSPRRQIWSPSHFTKAWAWSSSANPVAMEFRSSPTMPAAAHRAWSFGSRSRPTSSRRRADRLHGAYGRSHRIRVGRGPVAGLPPTGLGGLGRDKPAAAVPARAPRPQTGGPPVNLG